MADSNEAPALVEVDPDAIANFLAQLWPQPLPEGSRILIWGLKSKLSMWASNVTGAATSAARAAAKEDVYVGCGLGPAKLSTRQRAAVNAVTAIPGVWADIDFADGTGAHKKENLPTEEQALALIAEISDTILEPTIVIHSGHGFQAWWLAEAPWEFSDQADRHRASLMVHGWLALIRAKAAAHGWDLDATHDLARILRIAGTVNRKSAPVPVKMIPAGGLRFDWPELTAFLAPGWDVVAEGSTAPLVMGGDLALDPNAFPPFDKFSALLQNDQKFKKTWEHRRLDWTDRSQSAYDMGLANFGVAAGWDDQEITDLLIANRRTNGEDLKLRIDYYQRTCARARQERTLPAAAAPTKPPPLPATLGDAQPLEPAHPIATIPIAGDPPPPKDPPPTASEPEPGPDRNQMLAGLSVELFNGRSGDIRINRLVKFESDPPTYVLYLTKLGTEHEITLGKVDTLITQRSFRSAVAASSGVLIHDVGKAQWERRAQLMLDACEPKDLGDVGTAPEQVKSWIAEYLDQHKPSPQEMYREALNAKRPYLYDGYLALNLNSFAQWLNQSFGERLQRRELARYLRMAGYELHAQFLPASPGMKASTRAVWRIEART